MHSVNSLPCGKPFESSHLTFGTSFLFPVSFDGGSVSGGAFSGVEEGDGVEGDGEGSGFGFFAIISPPREASLFTKGEGLLAVLPPRVIAKNC